MILKSFEIENNINNLVKFKFILIYGENIGLKENLKKNIVNIEKNADVVNIYQEDLAKNKDVISKEIKNISLFSEKKFLILNQVNDKSFSEIEDLIDSKENVRILLVADLLDKRSKLRSLFEKDPKLAVIPCYNDNEITLKRLIQNELKEFKNINSNIINMILNYSNLNRKTIYNNIEKIKSFYDKKILEEDSLEILLNSDRNELFENIRDAALNGEKNKLNELLGNFTFANEDTYLYLNMIYIRLVKLLEIHKLNSTHRNINDALSKVKPPIFWKDKPVFLNMLQKWDKQRVIRALEYLNKIEKSIKINSSLNNLTIVKNSITNICSNSWIYF